MDLTRGARAVILLVAAIAVIGGAGTGLGILIGHDWSTGFTAGFVGACLWFIVEDISGVWKGKKSS